MVYIATCTVYISVKMAVLWNMKPYKNLNLKAPQKCYTLTVTPDPIIIASIINSRYIWSELLFPVPCSCSECDCHLSRSGFGDLPRPCLLQLHSRQLPSLQHHLASQWNWGPGSTSQSDHQHSPGRQQDTGEHSDPSQHHCRGHWHLHLFSCEY